MKLFRKGISLLLVLIMTVSMLPAGALAEEDPAETTEVYSEPISDSPVEDSEVTSEEPTAEPEEAPAEEPEAAAEPEEDPAGITEVPSAGEPVESLAAEPEEAPAEGHAEESEGTPAEVPGAAAVEEDEEPHAGEPFKLATPGAECTHEGIFLVERLEPTCTEAGHLEHWECPECHRLFAEEAAVTELTEEEVTLPGSHDFDDDHICTRCHTVDREYIKGSGTCGELLYWALTAENVLVITGSGDMADYFPLSPAPWDNFKGEIVRILLSDRISHIGSRAFYGMVSLTEISLPENVTSIGNFAFYHCDNLASVTMPSGACVLSDSVFGYCVALTKVVLPAGLTAIPEELFRDCFALEEVDIPANVTSIGRLAFAGCKALKETTIPAGVSEISFQCFAGCETLKEITLPAGVMTISERAFEGCTGLNAVTFDGNAPNIASNAFSGVEATAYFDPEKEWSTSQKAGYGGTLTWAPRPYVFASGECIAHGSLTDSAFWAFSSEGQLVVYGKGDMPDYTSAASLPWYNKLEAIKSVVIGKGITSIGGSAFGGCSLLASVTIADTVEYIMGSAFTGCTSLLSVTVPEGVKLLADKAFSGCTSLCSVSIPGSIGAIQTEVFYNCSSLSSVTIPEGITYVGASAFSGCSSLKTVTIPASLNTIAIGAFADAALESVYITDLTAWCSILVEANEEAHPLCGVEHLYLNGEEIKDMVIPEGCTQIRDDAFYGYLGLNSVTLPESLTAIGTEAFAGCTELHSILFKGNAPAISNDAFSKVTADVHYNPEKRWNEDQKASYGGTLTWAPCPHEFKDGVCILCGALDGRSFAGILEIEESYLLLTPGQTAQLHCTTAPEVFCRLVNWACEGDAITVDEGGLVTAEKEGTAYAVASLFADGTVYSARCRVDVTVPDPGETIAEQISEVQLITTAATAEIFRTADPAKITVLPVLEQNLKLQPKAGGNGAAALQAARFEDESLNAYITLRVLDDRTLEILPTEKAVADALSGNKALKAAYTSKLVVTAGGKDFPTDIALKLTLKKTLPSVKAQAVVLNSFEAALGDRAEIMLSGADVTAMTLETTPPAWLTVDEESRTLALSTTETPAKYPSGKLSFLCEAEGWAIPATVTVSYTVKNTAPSMKFGTKTVTLMPGTPDKADVTARVSNAPFTAAEKYPVTVAKIEQINGKTYTDIADLDPCLLEAEITDGVLTLRAPEKAADGKAHSYRVTLACAGQSFYYTVKTAAPAAPVLSAKVSGSINSMIAKSPCTVTLTLKNYPAGTDEEYSLSAVEQYKGKVLVSEDVKDLFTPAQDGNVFTLTEKAPGTLVSGNTYKAIFTADVDGDGAADTTATAALKITFAKAAPAVSVTAAAKGSIDLTRPGTAVTVTPTVKNWFGEEVPALVIYEKTGKVTSEIAPEDAPFTMVQGDDGSFTLKAGDSLHEATAAYTAAVRVTINGQDYTSKAVKLTVKAGKAAISADTKAVTLNKNDRFSEAPITLSAADSTVAPIDSAELDATSAKLLELKDYGNGNFALAYRDSTLPASFKATTAKLSVYVLGCDSPVATVSIKVSYQ